MYFLQTVTHNESKNMYYLLSRQCVKLHAFLMHVYEKFIYHNINLVLIFFSNNRNQNFGNTFLQITVFMLTKTFFLKTNLFLLWFKISFFQELNLHYIISF